MCCRNSVGPGKKKLKKENKRITPETFFFFWAKIKIEKKTLKPLKLVA